MIVEAEWNRRLGRGFNSRRLHHERTDRLGKVNRCVPDGGDMGSTRRDKGYAAIRLSYGLNSANLQMPTTTLTWVKCASRRNHPGLGKA